MGTSPRRDLSGKASGGKALRPASLDVERVELIRRRPDDRSASTWKLDFGAEADRGVSLTGLLLDDEICREVIYAKTSDDRSGKPVCFRGPTE